MEADLAHHYPRDDDQLPALYRGRLTLRRLRVLIKGLPQESATARAIGGHGWSVNDYLVADIYAALVEQPHPYDPRVAAKPVADDKLVKAHARSQKRREQLGIRGSVLRK